MHVAICDDSEIARELLVEFFSYYCANKAISYEIEQYETAVPLICDVEEGARFDIVFLDIYMGELLGIDAAHKLRELGYQGKIVFLTASPDFALAGYDVEAAGYLLKPLAFQTFSRMMDRMVKYFKGSTYPIRQRSKVIRIPYDEIYYIESRNSKCILHGKKEDYIIYKQLDKITEELNDRRFLRCHQSFLVNMDYVRFADKEFRMVNGATVLIRQKDLKAIKQSFLDYVNTKTRQI